MKNKTKAPLRLLSLFCPDHMYEEIEGDLIYKFNKDVKAVGEKRAKRRLMWNVIRFCRPGILLRRKFTIDNYGYMLINTIRFSLRHLTMQKSTTFIHVLGLTLGMSACLLITLFIHHELSFDSYHQNADRIFRINTVMNESEKQFNLWATPIPLGEALRKETTGIKYSAQAFPQFGSVIEIAKGKQFKQEHVLIVEPEFLDIFQVDVIVGTGREALRKPYQALLSESVAHKFFGDDYPVGKTFRYRGEFEITVAGIMRDLPSNTSLPAAVLLSFSENEIFLSNGDAWYFGNFPWVKLQASTFIVLEESTSPDKVEKQLNGLANKNINASSQLDKTIRGSFEIQPLQDIHLDDTRFGGGPWVKSLSLNLLWFFGMIGVMILFLACINFLNLSIAQGITRAKEVSIRKVIGARRNQLISQFLIETCMLTLSAGVLSIIVAHLLLNPLNILLNQNLSFQSVLSPMLLVAFFLALIFFAFLAGLYPSLVIARFKPLTLLKGGTTSARASWVQRTLVVTQFTISATLTICVLLIAKQVDFMQDKDLGLEKDNILQVPFSDSKAASAFVNEIHHIDGVKNVALSRSAPISNDHWWNTISNNETSERQSVCAIHADKDFYSVYDIQLVSGSIPQASSAEDTLLSKVVVNEKLIEVLNLGSAQEAIGKRFWWGGPSEIVGVVRNFNSEPLHYSISPAIIVQDPAVYTQANIRLQSNTISSTLSDIEKVWKKNFPNDVYEAKWMSDEIDAFYKTESNFYSLLLLFALLAIGISCMGLWGIASFVTLRRVKEVSIRKVLGATTSIILSLFIRQFLRPVLIAAIIALPLSWYAIDQILKNYAYKVEITWDMFIIPITILIIISIVTIGTQTIRASLTNPANNLQGE